MQVLSPTLPSHSLSYTAVMFPLPIHAVMHKSHDLEEYKQQVATLRLDRLRPPVYCLSCVS